MENIYMMVTQNMLRMHARKLVFKETKKNKIYLNA